MLDKAMVVSPLLSELNCGGDTNPFRIQFPDSWLKHTFINDDG